jgi:geranylgeranyl diphosphate synthase type II
MTTTGGRSFLDSTRADREAVEARCADLVDALAFDHPVIHDAIRYTLLGGGKRLRPILCLLAHDASGGRERDAALDAACAIECLHTYSLVHDDLPCMDDDDLRRGKPSAHVRFGEANAVLTGDALLTLAFEILCSIPVRHGVSLSGRALDAAYTLASAAGTRGLIAGQALDLESSSNDQDADIDRVERIHLNKTARLIGAAMEVGAVIAAATGEVRRGLREAGLLAGRAFQIIDDVLDLETDEETLGKTPGKDVKEGKLTFPSITGVEEARREADRLVQSALEALAPAEEGAALEGLRGAIRFMARRGA